MLLVIIALVIGIVIGWVIRGRSKNGITEPIEKEIQGVVIPAVKPELLKPEWYAALGGKGNIRLVEQIALTRIRVELINGALVNENALKNAGVNGVAKIDSNIVHLIV